MLQSDPHAARLDLASQTAAVADALADGARTAADLRKRFPELMPQEIARELGVAVETTDDDPMVASILRFAEYHSRPPRVLIYNGALATLVRVLPDDLSGRIIGPATLRDVFVAHELYHHSETTRAEVPISRRYQATLFRFGKWRWRTGIAVLSEIAAGAFAQSLLRLPCHPRVLDIVAIGSVRPATEASRVATTPEEHNRSQGTDAQIRFRQ